MTDSFVPTKSVVIHLPISACIKVSIRHSRNSLLK